MSLQVWLPLNGDLHNQGLKDVIVNVNGTTTFSSEGKIGQCLSCNGSTFWTIPSFSIGAEVSICCWIKTSTNGKMPWVLESDANNKLNLYMSSIYTLNTGDSNSNPFQNDSNNSISVLTDGKWHHHVVTFGNNIAKLYIDGIYHGKAKTFRNPTTTNKNFRIAGGYNNGTHTYDFNGLINDVRIYNHCLSTKEVEEISKGLVLHYLLNNSYYDNVSSIPANKYTNIDQQKGYLTSTNWTQTKLSGEDGYNYKLTRTGNGSGSWPNGGLGTFTFTAGKTYWYSCKIRCNIWSSGELRLRAARISNDYHPGLKSVVVCNNQLADGQWHEYYVSQVLPTTFNKSDGSSLTTAPRLEFYSSNQNENDVVYTMDFDLKELRVIESDIYYSLDLIQLKNIIYDSSGFNNNGYVIGNLGSTTPTPKYKLSTYFSKAPYIKNNNFIFNSNQWTISFWYYKPTNPSAYEGFFCLSKGDGTDANKKMAAMPNSGRIWYKGESGSVSISQLGIAIWTFLTMVCDGSIVTIYQNGTSIGTCNASTAMIGCTDLVVGGRSSSSGVNSITCPYEGNICDFRIYATALSADDIKELYRMSMNINGTNILPRDLE